MSNYINIIYSITALLIKYKFIVIFAIIIYYIKRTHYKITFDTFQIFKNKYNTNIPITTEELKIIQKTLLSDYLYYLSNFELSLDKYKKKF